MDAEALGLGAAIGLGVGALAAWLLVRAHTARLADATQRAADADIALAAAREQAVGLREAQARLGAELEAERRHGEERVVAYEAAETRLRDAFDALSRQALDQNSRSFLDLARTQLGEFQSGAKTDLASRQAAIDALLTPMRDALSRMDSSLRRVETGHGALTERVAGLQQSEARLVAETASLSMALRAPGVRGRWGEVQLRRVVELAGMLDHCDFHEQVTGEDGRLRPDLVVRLPGGRNIVVDAKAVMRAYIDAEQTADDAQRQLLLNEHARLVREHMMRLAAKGYRDQFQPTPEFVVMFLPGENFFRAALERDPELMDRSVAQRVVLASPLNLIALLWGAAQAWREQRIAETAQEVCDTGRELYKRLGKLAEHFDTLRKSLVRAVDSYNDAVGSLDRRVLPAARRFKELGAGTSDDIPELEAIDRVPETVQAPELLPLFNPTRPRN